MESNAAFEKRIHFEDLSKEDLIKKCKSFITIIQKAKQSKYVLQQEIEELKTKLDEERKYVMPPAIEELIQDLTQQKLSFVSNIEDLKIKNDFLQTNLNQLKEENSKLCSDINELDSANVAYKRQIDRLVDENDHLISHLESLEKQIKELNRIGLEQRDQLLKLEEIKNQADTNDTEKIVELENMLSISLEEIKKMKSESEEHKTREPVEGSVVDMQNLIETNDKLKVKLKFYHSKIIKLAVSTKQLKLDNEIILDQFKTYTEQVNEWKNKLNMASNELLVLFKKLEVDNGNLLRENQRLKDLNLKFMEQLEAHKTDDEKSEELEEVNALKLKNLTLTNELYDVKRKFDEIESENDQLKKRMELLKLEEEDCLRINMIEKQQLEAQINQLFLRNEEDICTTTKVQEDLKNSIALKDEELMLLKNQVENLNDYIEKYNVEKVELNREIDGLVESDKNHKQYIKEMEEKVKTLNTELEKSLATEKQLAEKSGEEILKLVQEIEVLAQNTSKLQEKIEEFEKKEEHSKCKLVNADIQTDQEFMMKVELEEEILMLRNENSQLLTEMNEMNQELKERGENLSKLEAHCEEIKKKIKIYETQANMNVNNLSEKEETIKTLQSELNNTKEKIGKLEEELERSKNENEILKEKSNVSYDNNYCESDIMSTSTISRAEEIERLKDLEGSWEEKYNKLRNLAIKLKAKLRDQTVELNKEKKEKDDAQQQLNNTTENLKTLKCNYEKICSELEETKNKCETVKDDNFNTSGDQEVTKLETEIENLRRDKAEMDNWKRQISVKVQVLRKQLEEKESLRKEYENKVLKLRSELETKDQALKLEIENHKQTRNSLQRYTSETKKNTVLNLEMQDYEKSVKDLSQKLEKKNDYIAKLKGQLDGQKEIMAVLKEQISTLEEKIQVCETDLDNAVTERSAYKKKTTEFESILHNKEDIILNIQQQLETIKSQKEELSTELSNDIAERQKLINNMKQERDALQLQNLNLQQTSRDLQQKLSLKEDELVAITKDYENYKIRAQSVLRQNQSRDIGLEEKLSGNVFSLSSQIETLNAEIEDLRNSKDSINKLYEISASEQRLLASKYEEASNQIKEIKIQYDELLTKYNQSLNEHNETVRSLKVQAETLGQCYRQQLSEQEVRHNREIIELQSKIEKANTPNEFTISSLPTMPREEGEGSESIESVNNLPIPLEKLLGNEEDQKVSVLKKQINQQESKLTHLTELLADTEQDLLKHVQMNKVLKEEIRRQQRAVEREKHAENMEYLKNIIFKFVTLHSGDERCRLIPVLNTILKLSPEEVQKLEMVAKGDPGLKAWSSYLPMWSSPNKQ